MDVFIPSPLPIVEPGDLLARLNKREVSPLVLRCARQYAEPDGKPQGWSEAELRQIKQDLSAYPILEYLSLAFVIRPVTVSAGPRGSRQSRAPLRGRISEQDAKRYRAALDWFAIANLVQTGTRLGICEACGSFFVDSKHRGKASCSPTCGGVLRARRHYEALRAKPRKLLAYQKKQAQLMRDRRAAGLA